MIKTKNISNRADILNQPAVDELFEAILMLKNKEETRRFLRDLLTESELLEFANRWKVAQMLYANVPYTEIGKETGMSSTTIARVSKWLRNGKEGYQLVLNKHHRLRSSSNA
jgi:TrpR-related protein YerC/YecD